MVQPFYRPALHGGQQLSSQPYPRLLESTGAFKPEILSDALHLDLPGLDMDKVAAYIENNQTGRPLPLSFADPMQCPK